MYIELKRNFNKCIKIGIKSTKCFITDTKRPYERFKYTIEDLKNAITAVQEKRMSANKASRHNNIPK